MDPCGNPSYFSLFGGAEKNIPASKMQDGEGFNLRLQRVEPIRNPEIEQIQTAAGVRWVMRGVGSDGTNMSKFISRDKYEELLNRERQFRSGSLGSQTMNQ